MIRSYKADDLGELLDAWSEASRVAHSFLSAEFLAKERSEIERQWLPMAETWVYEKEGQVVGFISLIGNVVGAIFVTPRHQGLGIGRTLMDHARASRDHLDLEVFEANEIGRAFYDAYGFKCTGARLHEETGVSQLHMHLDCKPAAD